MFSWAESVSLIFYISVCPSVGARLRGRGSAGEEFRGMGGGLVGARLRVRGSSSVG